MKKKVFVSGCFDVLHSGHIAFLQEAAQYGDLYVALGSDKTVLELKHRATLYTENERKYMLDALACVHKVYISPGSGYMDFVEVLDWVKPDIFFVNEDGDKPEKRKLCAERGFRHFSPSCVPLSLIIGKCLSAVNRHFAQKQMFLCGGHYQTPPRPVMSHGAGSASKLCLAFILETVI